MKDEEIGGDQDTEEPIVEENNFYVRGTLLPGYQAYCPLAPVYGYKRPDGTYIGSFPEQVFDPKEVLVNPGFLVVHLGSIEPDYTLETASQALHSSLKSLFAACGLPVDYDRIRTSVELSEFMKKFRNNYSHLILMGHGSPEGISFLDKRDPIAGGELSGYLGADASDKPLQIVSLCCHSGCARLAQALSTAPNITEVLAPNDAFDLRWVTHFITGLYLSMYINGLSVDEAVKKCAESSGNAPMCIWRRGSLVHDCTQQA
jgi:hypothetical protein